MADTENKNASGTTDAVNAKKRKGLWAKLTGKSSKADEAGDQEPKRKGGLMNSLMDSARQAATREVAHVAEDESKKEIQALLSNNNKDNSGSQPTTNTTTASNASPNATTTTSDALSAPTSWAKRMVDSAQQKMQGMQRLGS